MAKMKLFNMTFMSIGFMLNVTTVIILISDNFKTVMNTGAAFTLVYIVPTIPSTGTPYF